MSAHPQELRPWPADPTPEVKFASSTNRVRQMLFQLSLVASDASMLLLSCALAYWIRFELHLTVAPEVVPSLFFYTSVALVLIPAWLCLFALNGVYEWEHLLGGTAEYARAFHASTAGMMIVVLVSFFEPSFVIARGWLTLAWLLSVVLVCASRFCMRRLVYHFWSKGQWRTPTIVVGSNAEAISLARQIMHQPRTGYEVVGIMNTTDSVLRGALQVDGIPVRSLGSIEEIVPVLTRFRATEIIVAASSLHREELLRLYELIQPMQDVSIRLSTGLYEVLTTGVEAKTSASIPLIRLNRMRLNGTQTAMKTSLEYLVAGFMVFAVAPLMAVLAVLVKLDSPGPILHRRRVLGAGGLEFDAYKFRTMFVDADSMLERDNKLKATLLRDGKLREDPRITRLGKVLRRYSLDELPQLFNVLLGQMSLVGPRMITAPEASRYGRHKVNLMTVKPGITGLWQVSGRSELSYEDRVRLDMHYIRNYSIWLDLQILFVQTPSAVLRGRGAY